MPRRLNRLKSRIWSLGGGITRELRQAAATLPDERDTARRAGIALTPSELRAALEVSAEQDAAPLYREFERLWQAAVDTERKVVDLWVQRTATGKAIREERQCAREAIDAAGASLIAARQATERPFFRSGLNWNDPDAIDIGRARPVRTALHLLAAHASIAADDGDLETAIADLTAAHRAVEHHGQEPTVVALLAHFGLSKVHHSAFVQCIQFLENNVEALDRLSRLNRVCSGLPDLGNALRGELLFALHGISDEDNLMKSLREDDAEVKADGQKDQDRLLARLPFPLLRDAFEARVLSLYRRALTALAAVDGNPLTAYRALLPLIEGEAARREPSYRISADVAMFWEGLGLGVATVAARQRLRTALIAALRERRRTGAFPEVLPELPEDPFDGRPLRYETDGRTLLLYSVGPRGTDYGGDATYDDLGRMKNIAVTFP